MNLHRSSAKPDWEKVPRSSLTSTQRVAAATNGRVTPANIISLIGILIVIYGLIQIFNQQYWLGLVLLAVGRLLDVADGAVAEATKTKSPFGETVDAVGDKVGTILTIAVLFVAEITQWWVMVALLIPQLVIPLVIFYKKRKGIRVHPTRPGKLSMAAAWVGIVGLLLSKALYDPFALVVIVYSSIVASLLLGLYALWQYITGRN